MHLIKGDRSDDILLNYSSNSEQPMSIIVSQIFYLIGEFLSLQKRYDQFRDPSAIREQQAADICPRGRKIRTWLRFIPLIK